METKRCTKCLQTKALDAFSRRRQKHQAWCRACAAAHNNEHYKRSAWRRIRVKEQNLKNVARNRDYVDQVLSRASCKDCGNNNPVVLEFDHRDPAEKTKEIAYMVYQGWSIERLSAEMAKCDIRCANCHRIKTMANRKSASALVAKLPKRFTQAQLPFE